MKKKLAPPVWWLDFITWIRSNLHLLYPWKKKVSWIRCPLLKNDFLGALSFSSKSNSKGNMLLQRIRIRTTVRGGFGARAPRAMALGVAQNPLIAHLCFPSLILVPIWTDPNWTRAEQQRKVKASITLEWPNTAPISLLIYDLCHATCVWPASALAKS